MEPADGDSLAEYKTLVAVEAVVDSHHHLSDQRWEAGETTRDCKKQWREREGRVGQMGTNIELHHHRSRSHDLGCNALMTTGMEITAMKASRTSGE